MKQVTVLRKDRENVWEQTYLVKAAKGMTVLDALLEVQNGSDPSLAFRYACHWGVCGSCAMLINGVPRLACKTKIEDVEKGPKLAPLPGLPEPPSHREIFLAPLPNFPVIKDLVVDMRPFFVMYRSIDPWFRADGRPTRTERKLSPEEADSIERYAGCILCGACHGSCPEVATHPSFRGPAVLAKVYRFYVDPREGRGPGRLASVDRPKGWSACKFHSNCRKVCPAEVAPDRAVGRARGELRRTR